MDGSYEIIFRAIYKLPKLEDIPELPTEIKTAIRTPETPREAKELIGFEGETPDVFSCLGDNHGIKLRPGVFKKALSGLYVVFGPIVELRVAKTTLIQPGRNSIDRSMNKVVVSSDKDLRNYLSHFSVNLELLNLENASLVLETHFGPSCQKMIASRGELDEARDLKFGLERLVNPSNQFFDVSFIVNGEKIQAHKAILAGRSEYFSRMFSSGMKECQLNEVVVEDSTPKHFRLFLRVLYGGFSLLTNPPLDEVIGILILSDKYQITDMAQSCLKYIRRRTNETNVTAVLRGASEFNNDELREISFGFLKEMSEKDRWKVLLDFGDEKINALFIASL